MELIKLLESDGNAVNPPTPQQKLTQLEEQLKQLKFNVIAAELNLTHANNEYSFVANQINALKYAMIRMDNV